jgi:ankyrin repeat protein
LLAQVKQGAAPAVEQLLGGAADPNAVDSATGATPLLLAVEQRQPALLQLLLNSEWAQRQGSCKWLLFQTTPRGQSQKIHLRPKSGVQPPASLIKSTVHPSGFHAAAQEHLAAEHMGE